jgi:uncharacterized membrane protein
MPRGLTHASHGAKKGGALVLVGVIVLFGYLIYLDAVEDETLDDAYTLAYVLIAVLVLFGLWYVVFKVGWRMTERFIKAVDGTATYFERRFPQKQPYRLVTVSR